MTLTDRILSSILSNTRAPEDRKIGVEIECLYYTKEGQRLPVNIGESFSAQAMKDELEQKFSKTATPPHISIEPGGQMEWASPPHKTLFDVDKSLQQYFGYTEEIADREGLIQLDLSVEPLFMPESVELINQNKYYHMHNRFSLTGELGPWMMRNTTSVQINLDYSSLEEAEEMAFVADCITPLSSMMFSHSPFWNGKPANMENLRYRIWNNTDNERCGSLMDFGIVEKKGLLEGYSRLVQMTPAIFIRGTDDELLPFDGPMGKWLQLLEDANALSDDIIQLALHQLFTHVRFKKVVEMRNADRPPMGSELAPAAFWVGLLYSNTVRGEVYEIVNTWTKEERIQLQRSANQLGLDIMGPGNKTIRQWIERFSELAFKGLSERQKDNPKSEGIFLERYLDTLLKGGSPSIQVQDQFWRRGLPLKEFLMERYAGIF